MAITQKIVLKKNDEVSQKINLREIFGSDVDAKTLSKFAEMAIDYIIERSQSNKDLNGKPFAQYSKDYALFKGVSRNDVDMTLSSDMLLSIGFEVDGSKIKIKVGDDEVGKAYGHMTGFKGHPFISGPKREFFGLRDEEVISIASDLIGKKKIKKDKREEVEENIDEIISRLRIEVDDE
jgi:hypothetical protein